MEGMKSQPHELKFMESDAIPELEKVEGLQLELYDNRHAS